MRVAPLLRTLLLAISLSAAGARLAAQTVRGVVVLRDSTTPLIGAIVAALASNGSTAARALSGERGEFTLKLPAPGRYTLRVLRIGYRPSPGPVLEMAGSATESVRLVFSGDAITLTAVTVRGRNECRVRPDTGLLVAQLWEEARKAMLASQLSTSGAPLHADWVEYDRTLDPTGKIVRDQRVRTASHPTTHAFKSLAPELLAANGYVLNDSTGVEFHAPDANVLLSDSFAATHCLRLAPEGDRALIGVAFQPATERKGFHDIEGTLWIDRASAELRRLEFHYTSLPSAADNTDAGGRLDFLRLGGGDWVISAWTVRMPKLVPRDKYAEGGTRKVIRAASNDVVKAIQITGGEVNRVMRGDSTLHFVDGSRLDFRVVSHDSVVPAAGTIITLDGTDYTTETDESGYALLWPLLAGRYTARIRAPILDSLGVPPIARELDARLTTRTDSITLPSAQEALLRACPKDSVMYGEGMVRGFVRDEHARPLAHAAVTVTWQRYFRITGDQLGWNEQTIGALTDDRGMWRTCGVPRDTLLVVRVLADSGSDRRTTKLGLPQAFGSVDLVARVTHTLIAEREHRPTALVELFVTSLDGVPLANVALEVTAPGGTTRKLMTGPSGRALVPDVAPGLLKVEAKRIGFKPGKLALTVEPGRNTAPIVLSETTAPQLDTVRVMGGRKVAGRLDEFETRKLNHDASASIGRAEIEKRNAPQAWHLLMNVPSMKIIQTGPVVTAESNRAMIMGQPCYMNVLVDGIPMAQTADIYGKLQPINLNDLPPMSDIHGIEVFAGSARIPLRYAGEGGGKWCGLILVWTR